MIDILAAIATVTGMATSVGLEYCRWTGIELRFQLPSGPVTQIV